MAFYHIVILALIQGITEFLPVSSSGHLVLYHGLVGDEAATGGQMIDIAVHVGTLFAVLVYFRDDVMTMITALFDRNTRGQNLWMLILIGSAPVILAGLLLHLWDPAWLRAIEVMAWATLLFGILLLWVDQRAPQTKDLNQMTMKDAVFIGVSQALALIPGTSRSGITMTAARWLGFNRREAARYSLLLAFVAISGAGTLGSMDLIASGNAEFALDALIAAFLAFLSGWAAIALMMAWLERAGFAPFAWYRIVLGVVLLGLIYGGVLV